MDGTRTAVGMSREREVLFPYGVVEPLLEVHFRFYCVFTVCPISTASFHPVLTREERPPSFHKGGNRFLESLSNLPKVTQLIRATAKFDARCANSRRVPCPLCQSLSTVPQGPGPGVRLTAGVRGLIGRL